MNYRSEIDGLRAISVLIVVLYHAQFTLDDTVYFTGGFIGVDIFFVISGFLITRIILDELSTNSKFNFLQFYERRARRILPMLFTIILVSLPFSWLILLPKDLIEFGNSTLSALAFYSNFFFYNTVTQYGATDALLKPLLHTWSLAVEEQFYIFAPLTLFIIWKYAKKYCTVILLLLILTSLIIAQGLSYSNPPLNFFHSLSRFWELLFGALLQLVGTQFSFKSNKFLSPLMALLGLFLICFSIFNFHSSTHHPNLTSIPPLIGAGLIILFCSREDIVGRFLSLKPLVAVGLLSYSLYLWHFPIFSFYRLHYDQLTNQDRVLLILLSMILSIISYFLIEKPFRRTLSKKWFYTLIALSLSVIIGCAIYFNKTEGRMSEFPSILQEVELHGSYEPRDADGIICSVKKIEDYCLFSQKKSPKHLFIVGDSVAASLAKPFVQNHEELGLNIHILTRFSCFFAPGTDHYQPQPKLPCDSEYQAKRLDIIKKYHNGIIIISGMLDYYMTNNAYLSRNSNNWEKAFADEIQNLIDQGFKIVLVYPSPGTNKHLGRTAINFWRKIGKDWKFKFGNLPDEAVREINAISSVATKDFMNYSKHAFETLNNLPQEEIIRIYPHKIICNERCYFAYEGNLFFIDKTHFSAFTREKIFSEIMHLVQEQDWMD